MGTDYTAYAIIGVELPKDKMARIIKHSKHDVPGSANFCPECGMPAQTERHVFRFEEDWKIGPFDIVTNVADRFYVGLIAKDWHDCDSKKQFVEIVSLDVLRDELMDALVPYGLWDETKFGLYAAMDISY